MLNTAGQPRSAGAWVFTFSQRCSTVSGDRCLRAFVGVGLTLVLLAVLSQPGLFAGVEYVPLSLLQSGGAAGIVVPAASPTRPPLPLPPPASPVASPERARFAPSTAAPGVPPPIPTPKVATRSPRAVQVGLATVAEPTAWAALNQAIVRIPSYRPWVVQWVVMGLNGWGLADLSRYIIYISPDVPLNRLYDVAVHEWSHILSVVDYQGALNVALVAMNNYYQTTGMYGSEIAADCMAILQGAQWTHYTPCTYQPWRSAARRLVAGTRI